MIRFIVNPKRHFDNNHYKEAEIILTNGKRYSNHFVPINQVIKAEGDSVDVCDKTTFEVTVLNNR